MTFHSAKIDTAQAAVAHRAFPALPRPNLDWTPEVEAATAHLYERVSRVIPPVEWPFHAPYVKAINELKKVRNAVVLAHNYQTPEIYHCVSDYIGDSLQLAKLAAQSDADVIVQGGVYFMAETSKILSPEKTVLIPDAEAGCSLAASITAADIRTLRREYPGVPIVAYVNTSAEVKAEVDICCTSSNAVKVVESLGADTVIMVPDRFLAQNVAAQTKVKIIAWHGACEVHELFTADEILGFKADHPGLKVIAHPECPREVVEVSDFSGSTAAMIDYVRKEKPARVMLVTECSMADNVAAETKGTEFIRPCNFCPHMKRITLPKILDALLNMREEVLVDPEIAARARLSVQRMIDLG
ncbi:quinolinate synthase [freshwater sediment metagenome]|uniref:quinolinate synthase n=1 Tax=freshwater sediment metagenome TaxID=556182 RepID=A0AA48LYL0_9ZZZZ